MLIKTLLGITKQDKLNFVCAYGLGDTFTILKMRAALEKKYNEGIHFIIKKSHKIIMDMFGVNDYSIHEFSHDEMVGIGKNNFIPVKGLLYIAHPIFSDNTGFMDRHNKDEFTYKVFFHRFFLLDENTPLLEPIWYPSWVESAKPYPELHAYDMDKSVLFLPEARTVPLVRRNYWEELARELQDKGFFVVQSCTDGACRINNVPILPDDLYVVIAFAISCHSVYALRNGLCDVIEKKVKYLTVIFEREFDYIKFSMSSHNIRSIFVSQINETNEKKKSIYHFDKTMIKQYFKKLPFIKQFVNTIKNIEQSIRNIELSISIQNNIMQYIERRLIQQKAEQYNVMLEIIRSIENNKDWIK